MEELTLNELCEDGEFNQKCKFGKLVNSHAVYCKSPDRNAPMKCRRTWFYGEAAKNMQDEDCPYYEPNKNLTKNA